MFPDPPIFGFKKCIVAFCKIIACADIAGQDQIALKRAVWSGSAVFCKIIDIELMFRLMIFGNSPAWIELLLGSCLVGVSNICNSSGNIVWQPVQFRTDNIGRQRDPDQTALK